MEAKEEKIIVEKGEHLKISPDITGESEWVEGEVIDVEKNPFRGIVISIKDKFGRIFWAEPKFFQPA